MGMLLGNPRDRVPLDKMPHGKLTVGQMPQRKINPGQNSTVLLFVSQEDENTPPDKEMLPNTGINVHREA